MKKKVAIYARIAADGQRNVAQFYSEIGRFSEGSIHDQVDRLINFKNDSDETSTSTRSQTFDVYTDEGYSASNLERPGLKAMLLAASKSKIDTIMVTDVSRLSRSPNDLSHLSAFFQAHNVSVVSLINSFEATKISDLAMFHLMDAGRRRVRRH